MPTNPFAALEARVNSAVESHLSNATATYQGGVPFGVVLDQGQTDAFDGGSSVLDASDVVVSFNLSHAPGLAERSQLTINGAVYTVLGGVQPDSSGWVQRVAVAALKG
jgi:hypothetical protein